MKYKIKGSHGLWWVEVGSIEIGYIEDDSKIQLFVKRPDGKFRRYGYHGASLNRTHKTIAQAKRAAAEWLLEYARKVFRD